MLALTKTRQHAAIIIVYLCVVGQFAIDSYLSSLPSIAQSLHVANSSAQLSITFFLLGAVPAQFIFGTLSDYFGRRPFNIFGVIVFVFSSLLCLFAANIQMFLFGRLLQGFGIGSGFVLAWASARDMYEGKAFTKFISLIAAITILLPVVSPIVGGYIQLYLGWRYTFALLLAMGIILLVAMLIYLPETLLATNKQSLQIKNIYRAYKTLFMSRVFLTNTFCSSFATASVIIYITITPFLYQRILHLSPVVFSWLTALVAIGVATGCIINAKLVEKTGATTLIKIGISGMSCGIVIMLIFALLNILNLYVILLPMLIVTLSIGFIVPNTSSRAMDPFSQQAGSASAMYSGVQMLVYSLASALAAMFYTVNQKPLVFLLLVIPVVIVLLQLIAKRSE